MDDIFKAHHERTSPPFCPRRSVRLRLSIEMTPMRFWSDQGKSWVELRGFEPLTSSIGPEAALRPSGKLLRISYADTIHICAQRRVDASPV